MILLGRSRTDPSTLSLLTVVVVGFLALQSSSANAFLAPRHAAAGVDFRPPRDHATISGGGGSIVRLHPEARLTDAVVVVTATKAKTALVASPSLSKSLTTPPSTTRLGAVVFEGDEMNSSGDHGVQHATSRTMNSDAELSPLAPAAAAAVPTTMGQALTTFFLSRTYHGPRTVVLVLLELLAAWWHVSTNAVLEGAVASTAVLFWSIQEHWMHQHLLHSRADWMGKQMHEKHHDKNYFYVSIDPTPLLLGWFGTAFALLAWILPSWPLTVAATFGYGAAGLFYEWSH